MQRFYQFSSHFSIIIFFFCIVVGCFSFISIYYGRFYCIRRRYKIWLLITKGYLNARLSHWRRFLSNKTRIQPTFFLFRYNVKQQNNNKNSSEHSLEKSVTNLSNWRVKYDKCMRWQHRITNLFKIVLGRRWKKWEYSKWNDFLFETRNWDALKCKSET